MSSRHSDREAHYRSSRFGSGSSSSRYPGSTRAHRSVREDDHLDRRGHSPSGYSRSSEKYEHRRTRYDDRDRSRPKEYYSDYKDSIPQNTSSHGRHTESRKSYNTASPSRSGLQRTDKYGDDYFHERKRARLEGDKDSSDKIESDNVVASKVPPHISAPDGPNGQKDKKLVEAADDPAAARQKRLEKLEAWKKSKSKPKSEDTDNRQLLAYPASVDDKPASVGLPSGISSFGISGTTNSRKEPESSRGIRFEEEEKVGLKSGLLENIDRSTEDMQEAHAKDEALVSEDPSPQRNHEDENEGIDPLDAYMSSIGGQMDQPSISRADQTILGDELDVEDREEDQEGEDLLALAKRRMKKKDLGIVDHSKVHYEDFRKDFYVEPAELANLSEAEVDEMRLLLDGIKIRGQNCPKPIQLWSQCGLPSSTLEVIRSLEYERPTSIQAQSIPAIMSGRDVIGVAKTGSGKTVAFLIPMFRHIKDQRPLENLEGPIALIMTPTRELAVQIHRECKPFLKALNLRATCAYGGSPIKDQIAELKRGAEIVVCTPGRMIDVLAANQGRVTNLRRVTYVVLDEADRMFDLGFEPQVNKIMNNIRPNRQTVLFSATFPKQMEGLAKKILTKPVEITVGARSVVAAEISQIVEVREERTKFVRLLEVLGELYNDDYDARTLIFVDRQDAADGLLRDLMRRGYPSNSIHGGKDQYDRDSTISDFKNGVFPILVATSVAARGLDVKQLKLVINYDCPNHLEDYVHRVGRTGRAGNTGVALTFVTPAQDRYAVDIVKALTLSKQKVPESLQKLSDGFLGKVKEGREKAAGTGFGGKGLEKFDEQRKIVERIQRKAYGAEEDQEEEDVIPEGDDDEASPAPTQDDTLNKVRDAASSAAKARGDAKPAAGRSTTVNIVQGDRGDYQAALEINDFPQRARWAVTNRTNQVKVLDQTGTSITTKGISIPHGRIPQPGEEKLYLLIEGETQVAVQRAVDELKRLLQEGTVASMESDRMNVGTSIGRYSVL